MSQAPGSHFKMLITQPRSIKNQNGPRTSLMGPGRAVWGKNRLQKISWDCPSSYKIPNWNKITESPKTKKIIKLKIHIFFPFLVWILGAEWKEYSNIFKYFFLKSGPETGFSDEILKSKRKFHATVSLTLKILKKWIRIRTSGFRIPLKGTVPWDSFFFIK